MTDATGRYVDGNVAARLDIVGRLMDGAVAIAEAERRRSGPPVEGQTGTYRLCTFGELSRRSSVLARGFHHHGIGPGDRIVMLVPFGISFITLVFAILKTGAEMVLIDPGMDRRHLVDCLSETRPTGFVGIPKAHVARWWFRRRFPDATKNVAVGPRRFLGMRTLHQIEVTGRDAGSAKLPERQRSDAAAIIFTTGSTGPPKGVAYTHGTFHSQIDRIADRYDIHRGSRDLACFPLFGLFDAMMGVTAIIPDMDPTRPADIDPRKLIRAAEDWQADQAFGSPALWKTVVQWAEDRDIVGRPLHTLHRVLSAGAPVPASTLRSLRHLIAPEADVHTPYGATEALPIASIESRQILTHTGPAAEKGKGVCVGQRFPTVRWKVIEVDDGPIATSEDWCELPTGKIGELVVSGPMVTERYVTRTDQNALHKVASDDGVWHRMGDVGYLDDDDRFWFCGRKAHRVPCGNRTLWTVPCEAIFNVDPEVIRCALIGIGSRPNQTPLMVIECADNVRTHPESRDRLIERLRDRAARNPLTRRIERFEIWPGSLPVDIRHNSKIFREKVAAHYER